MKKILAPILGFVLLALSISACSTTPTTATAIKQVSAVDQNGNAISAPTATFSAGGSDSLDSNGSQILTEYVPGASAGSAGLDATGGLSLSDVQVNSNIQVTLADGNPVGLIDQLDFSVTADAGTPTGTYPVQVTLNNAQGTDSGVVTFNVVVQ